MYDVLVLSMKLSVVHLSTRMCLMICKLLILLSTDSWQWKCITVPWYNGTMHFNYSPQTIAMVSGECCKLFHWGIGGFNQRHVEALPPQIFFEVFGMGKTTE